MLPQTTQPDTRRPTRLRARSIRHGECSSLQLWNRTQYVYDGNNLLQETDDVGLAEAEFTYIPLPYAEVLSQRRDTESSFYLADGIRNIRQLTDDSEVVTDEYAFDAFGVPISTTGSTANSQLYKGQLLAYHNDPHAGPENETSLHHRNLAANTGRFTSEDPAADDINLYRPVGNNPVNREDPSGLLDDLPPVIRALREVEAAQRAMPETWAELDAIDEANRGDPSGLFADNKSGRIFFYNFRLQPLEYYRAAGWTEEQIAAVSQYGALIGDTFGDEVDAVKSLGLTGRLTRSQPTKYTLYEGRTFSVRKWTDENANSLYYYDRWDIRTGKRAVRYYSSSLQGLLAHRRLCEALPEFPLLVAAAADIADAGQIGGTIGRAVRETTERTARDFAERQAREAAERDARGAAVSNEIAEQIQQPGRRVAGQIDEVAPRASGPAHNAANAARLREQLARQEFASQARWKTSTAHGDELAHHAYQRHPSLATNEAGLIDAQLYNQRALTNITAEASEIHHIGGTRYAAFNSQTGEFTVFSWEGGGGLSAGSPTLHSYYIPLRNQMKTGIPFQSQGIVRFEDIRPR